MQPRKAEWLHIFNELLEKDFPTAVAGLWLDVLNQKLYWVDPPETPLPGSESAEELTKDVEQALAAASDFLGESAAKINRLALDREGEKWCVGQSALKQIQKGCIEIIRTRRGTSPAERARAVAEALGDPNFELIQQALTEAEFNTFRHDFEAATKA
jgi:hypothetical protein